MPPGIKFSAPKRNGKQDPSYVEQDASDVQIMLIMIVDSLSNKNKPKLDNHLWCGHIRSLSRPGGVFPSSGFRLRRVHHRSSTPEQSRRKRNSKMHTETYGRLRAFDVYSFLQEISPNISPSQANCFTWAPSALSFGSQVSARGYFLSTAFRESRDVATTPALHQ